MKIYKEGELFSINLGENKQILGLIARKAGSSKLLFGYFWDTNFDKLEEILLKKDDAIYCNKFSGLGFEKGGWKILGMYRNWSRDDWSLPEFYRKAPFIEKIFAIKYDENFEEISERIITVDEAQKIPKDISHGYNSLENHLKMLIG